MKKCPFCAEDIQGAAIVCKHCRRDLPSPVPRTSAGTIPGIVLDEQLGRSVEPERSDVATPPTVNWALNSGLVGGASLLIIGATIVYISFFQGPFEEPAVSATTTKAQATVTVPGERRISRADYGDRWPFTVSEGVLSCMVVGKVGTTVVEAVYFRVGATTYPLNGVAKGRGGPAVEAIWKTYAGREPTQILTRVPEVRRRELFRVEAACLRQSQDAADAKFPGASTISELKTSGAYGERVRMQCMKQVRSKDKLTEDELDLVDAEGYARGWPPATAVRPSTSPIIIDGLKLCSR